MSDFPAAPLFRPRRVFSGAVFSVFAALMMCGGGLLQGGEGSSQDLLRQGIRLANERKHDEALEKLRAAVSLDAGNTSAYLALGMVALQAQNYQEARRALERAAELQPSSLSAFYGLGMIYEKFREPDKARAAWRKFIGLSQEPELREMAQRHLDRLN